MVTKVCIQAEYGVWYSAFSYLWYNTRGKRYRVMNYVIVNILVIILECIGLWISVRARKWKVFVF